MMQNTCRGSTLVTIAVASSDHDDIKAFSLVVTGWKPAPSLINLSALVDALHSRPQLAPVRFAADGGNAPAAGEDPGA